MPYPLGVSQTAEGVQFALYKPYGKKCRLHLYRNGKIENKETITMDEYLTGDVFSICFLDKKLEDFKGYQYSFQLEDSFIPDPYAKKITGREKWGIRPPDQNGEEIRGVVFSEPFNWEDDEKPNLSYSNLYLYQLHVRGFTKHPSSKVKEKGTFRGIIEKISHLKELGINGVLLLPCYDFDEILEEDIRELTQKYLSSYSYKENNLEKKEAEETKLPLKINYWGYTKRASYFAPKASFSKGGKNSESEMKELVKALHKEGIEIILDMFFDRDTNPNMILDCLRYWALEYHIDGFRVNDNVVPVKIAALDPVIGSVKLLATRWEGKEEGQMINSRLGEYNEGFLISARRYLKSDEGQVNEFMCRIRRNPKEHGVINYLTSVNGFTLMDLVSYDIKHNEKNGESGRDGTDFNYSWNCGIEGRTRKKNTITLRKQQIRNGLIMLIFSQGTPMILAGDEFGNSQEGNNNAYCQDNPTSWLNWDNKKSNKDIFCFIKDLIALRKAHPILHKEEELKGMDYISSGSPDISFHGTKAWYVDNSNYSRILGVMLNGAYAKINRLESDDSFYIAYNMHWEPHVFDLPALPEGKKWSVLIDSSKNEICETKIEDQKSHRIPSRVIIVFIGK